MEGARGALFKYLATLAHALSPRASPHAAGSRTGAARCTDAPRPTPYVRTRDGHAARASARDRDTRGADPTAGAWRIHKSPRSTRTSYRLYVRACFEQTVAWTLGAQAGVAAGPHDVQGTSAYL